MALTRTKKLTFGLLVVGLFIGLAELGVRFSSWNELLSREGWAREQARLVNEAYNKPIYTEEKPGQLVPRREPFRKVRFALPKPAGTYRVVLLGDSTAWGSIDGVPEHDLSQFFHTYLTGALRRALAPCQVELLNMALPGGTSDVVLARTAEAVTLEPDLLLAYVGYNDHNPLLFKAINDPDYMKKGFLRRNLRLLDLVWFLVLKQINPADQVQSLDRHHQTTANVAATLARAKKAGVPMYFIVPVMREPEPDQAMEKSILKGAKKHNVKAVLVKPALDRAIKRWKVPWEELFSDPIHPRGRANKVMGETVVQALKGRGDLPPCKTARATSSDGE